MQAGAEDRGHRLEGTLISVSSGDPAHPGELGSTAALAIGLTLLTFGSMITMIGVILSGICLVDEGAICQDTGIGSIGFGMLAFGVPAVLIGIPLFARGRKADKAAEQARLAGAATLQPPVDEPGARALTECPHCGAPISPGARECEFCGGYLAG